MAVFLILAHRMWNSCKTIWKRQKHNPTWKDKQRIEKQRDWTWHKCQSNADIFLFFFLIHRLTILILKMSSYRPLAWILRSHNNIISSRHWGKMMNGVNDMKLNWLEMYEIELTRNDWTYNSTFTLSDHMTFTAFSEHRESFHINILCGELYVCNDYYYCFLNLYKNIECMGGFLLSQSITGIRSSEP